MQFSWKDIPGRGRKVLAFRLNRNARVSFHLKLSQEVPKNVTNYKGQMITPSPKIERITPPEDSQNVISTTYN